MESNIDVATTPSKMPRGDKIDKTLTSDPMALMPSSTPQSTTSNLEKLNSGNQRDPVNRLPKELLVQVFKEVGLAAALACGRVSRAWHSTLITDDFLTDVMKAPGWFTAHAPPLECEKNPDVSAKEIAYKRVEVENRFKSGRPVHQFSIAIQPESTNAESYCNGYLSFLTGSRDEPLLHILDLRTSQWSVHALPDAGVDVRASQTHLFCVMRRRIAIAIDLRTREQVGELDLDGLDFFICTQHCDNDCLVFSLEDDSVYQSPLPPFWELPDFAGVWCVGAESLKMVSLAHTVPLPQVCCHNRIPGRFTEWSLFVDSMEACVVLIGRMRCRTSSDRCEGSSCMEMYMQRFPFEATIDLTQSSDALSPKVSIQRSQKPPVLATMGDWFKEVPACNLLTSAHCVPERFGGMVNYVHRHDYEGTYSMSKACNDRNYNEIQLTIDPKASAVSCQRFWVARSSAVYFDEVGYQPFLRGQYHHLFSWKDVTYMWTSHFKDLQNSKPLTGPLLVDDSIEEVRKDRDLQYRLTTSRSPRISTNVIVLPILASWGGLARPTFGDDRFLLVLTHHDMTVLSFDPDVNIQPESFDLGGIQDS